jgi:hypothetical protein
MMDDICERIQEQIPELITGTLPAEKAEELRRHIDTCPACSEYLRALQADDRLLSDFAEAMQPSVSRLEDNVLDVLNGQASEKRPVATSIRSMILKGPVIKFAAAAVLLIAGGYAVGRLSAPAPVDVEQLQASLEPAIRAALLEDLNRRWQLALASNHAQLQDGLTQIRNELAEQQRRDMGEFAAKTLYASNAVTNQLLRDLTRALAFVQRRDRRLVAAALRHIESSRLQDKTRLTNGLVSLAAQTSNELRQTKHDVAKLFVQSDPDKLMPSVPETLNERSEK